MQATMYTSKSCSACTAAKELLRAHAIPVTTVMVDQDITLEEVREQFPDAKQLPVTIIDGNCIVGLARLRSFLSSLYEGSPMSKSQQVLLG